MNEELIKRLQSLAWRSGAAAVVAGCSVLIAGLEELQAMGVPTLLVAFLALAGGELTKTLNKKYQLGKAKTRKRK